jgi:hypothetical protein
VPQALDIDPGGMREQRPSNHQLESRLSFFCFITMPWRSSMMWILRYRRGDDDSRKRAPGHPAYKLVNGQVSSWRSAGELRELVNAVAKDKNAAYTALLTLRAGKLRTA